MAAVIDLHWTATGYDWIRSGHYHSIIGGDGRVHRYHAYSVDLPATPMAATATASPSPAPVWAASPTLDPAAHSRSAQQLAGVRHDQPQSSSFPHGPPVPC